MGGNRVALTTAELSEPSPSERGLAVRNALGKLEIECRGSIDTRAATLDGLDNLEDRVGSGLGICCDGKLARATTVDCTTLEAQRLLLANSHSVHLGDGEAKVGLARELRGCDWAAVDLVDAVWDR
jgi:hypothetical protein